MKQDPEIPKINSDQNLSISKAIIDKKKGSKMQQKKPAIPIRVTRLFSFLAIFSTRVKTFCRLPSSGENGSIRSSEGVNFEALIKASTSKLLDMSNSSEREFLHPVDTREAGRFWYRQAIFILSSEKSVSAIVSCRPGKPCGNLE